MLNAIRTLLKILEPSSENGILRAGAGSCAVVGVVKLNGL